MENFQFRPEEQSQEIPLYNEEEIESFQPVKTEETPQVEKSQDLSQPSDKIINRHKIRYTATRIKYSPTRLIFYRIFPTPALTKMIFTMKASY